MLLWLGYFNSAINPIIYARFNREFRRPFIEILCFRCFGINEKLRDEERKKMYIDVNNIHNLNYKESPNSISTSGLNNYFINNKHPKKTNFNNSVECLSKFDMKNEKNENCLIKNEELELTSVDTNVLKNDINNEDLELNISKIINRNSQLFENEVTSQNNANGSIQKINETKDNTIAKKYKLNELILFRFYNLTIIDGIQPCFDKPVLSLRIRIPKKHSNKKTRIKKEFISNLPEKKKIYLRSNLKNELLPTNKSFKLLKHQSLTLNDSNNYNKNNNFKRMKQSASTDEFKSISKYRIRTNTLTPNDISMNF